MRGADLGKRIRLLRKRLGLTQAEFGKQVGTTKLSVARYEVGRIPRVEVLDRIALRAGVSLTWLLHGTENEVAGSQQKTADFIARRLTPQSFVKVSRLPHEYQVEYQGRINEAVEQLRHQLEEYAELLEARFRQKKAMSKPSR